MTLSGPPTSWPVAAWECYAERCGHREAAGESPLEASLHAAEDTRRWYAGAGDAFFATLPPVKAAPVVPSATVPRRRRAVRGAPAAGTHHRR